MPKAFFCIPSARPVAEVLPVVAKWREMGYGVVLQRDLYTPEESEALSIEGVTIYWREYAGYADAVNYLSAEVLRDHPEVDWVCTGGDDTLPDPNKTGDEIAGELSQYFRDKAWPKCWHWAAGYATPEKAIAAGAYAEQKPQGLWSYGLAQLYSTWGICQPTGDDWSDNLGRIIERIAGSPWMGRTWCERANSGKGPLWPEYEHCFVDEELQEVAIKLGVFLQRPDITHFHNHPQRGGKGKPAPHMAKWAGATHWRESSTLFKTRKAAGFPGHEPIL